MGDFKDIMKRASGEDKWARFNDAVKLYCEELVRSGKVERFVQKNYVPGKVDHIYLVLKDERSLSVDERRGIFKEYSVLRGECGISIDEVIEDSQMGINFVTESTLSWKEGLVSKWAGTV